MIDDALKLTIDLKFKVRSQKWDSQESAFEIENYENNTNIWKLIIDD